jgi:hypothetical protein
MIFRYILVMDYYTFWIVIWFLSVRLILPFGNQQNSDSIYPMTSMIPIHHYLDYVSTVSK